MSELGTMLILILALPLGSAVFTALAGRWLLRTRSHWPTIGALGCAFVLSVLVFLDVRYAADTMRPGQAVGFAEVWNVWTWVDIQGAYSFGPIGAEGVLRDFNIEVVLRVDTLTSAMLMMVTFVSTCVAIYAAGYMHGDRGYWRFYAYVSLFVFSMLLLVTVSNFVLLYVAWEAVGLCSYLLVGFWYEKPSASAAAKKAFLVNRVSDFGFMLGLFLIWTTYGTLNYHDTTADGVPVTTLKGTDETAVPGVLGQSRLAHANPVASGTDHDEKETAGMAMTASQPFVGGGIGLAICLLLMVGACGKSAQFPLHVWLPDAMEGPTPVSALIHAATMVTAGVYMIARCSPLFIASLADPWTVPGTDFGLSGPMVVAIIGGFTALFAGLIAPTQMDLKRVLAYSTISQIGYMFLGLGTASVYGIAGGMFHLFTHAFFKALLFLSAGSVMHTMGNTVDMNRFSGLRRIMPITCIAFLMGGCALAGLWPFAGAFSKDQVLCASLVSAEIAGEGTQHYSVYMTVYWLGVATAFLTALYTFRAFYLTFFGDLRVPPEGHSHESPSTMTGPMVILSFFAVGLGFALSDVITAFLAHAPSLAYVNGFEAAGLSLATPEVRADHIKHLHHVVLLTTTGFVLAGIAVASFLFLGDRKEVNWLTRQRWARPFYLLSFNKFYIDEIYGALVVIPMTAFGWISWFLERYVIDGLVEGIGWTPRAVGALLRSLQNGLVQFYAFLMVLVLLIFLLGTFWPGGLAG